MQEQVLKDCGVPYAIVRPTLVFGRGDILVNNIAWLLRRFPVFPIFGSGQYRVQPVHVDDLADIAVVSAAARGSITLDAIGPEDFTFLQLVQLIASNVAPRVQLVHVPPAIGVALGRPIGLAVRDVLLTRAELQGLMNDWLTSDQPPNGRTRFSEWLELNKEWIGKSYASEVERHFREHPY